MTAPNPPEAVTPLVGARDASRDRWSGVIIALLLLAAFALVGHRVVGIARGPLPPGRGQLAPQFSAPGPDGAPRGLAELADRVVLIDFWATWCPPCVASMPTLAKLHRELSAQGFSVLGVNIEPGDELKVRAFLRERGIDFPVVVDPGHIARRYGVFSYPTSFLVGRDGVIRSVHHGPANESSLRRAIEAALAEARVGS
ncbi:MAG: TlpA family protein disulfide reductase [Deltaproteobacteria bacterium]|nr:TlpA family protein disulfide reductase [Deltaproteobacteria bacterium]